MAVDGYFSGAHPNGLLSPSDNVRGPDDVPNGIAYDAKDDRLFVTGKNWPKLFEIRLLKSDRTAWTSAMSA